MTWKRLRDLHHEAIQACTAVVWSRRGFWRHVEWDYLICVLSELSSELFSIFHWSLPSLVDLWLKPTEFFSKQHLFRFWHLKFLRRDLNVWHMKRHLHSISYFLQHGQRLANIVLTKNSVFMIFTVCRLQAVSEESLLTNVLVTAHKPSTNISSL